MADVTTRGFSGYNTRWCKIVLPSILDSMDTKSISCVTIFLGANDCSLPESDQHVPVAEFQQNLETMIRILERRGIDRRKVVLITPPTYFHSHYEVASTKDGDPMPLRSGDTQSIYAKAMIELGQNLSVSVVDAFSAFDAGGRGADLFYDGLHFSPAGSDLLCIGRHDCVPCIIFQIILFYFEADNLNSKFGWFRCKQNSCHNFCIVQWLWTK